MRVRAVATIAIAIANCSAPAPTEPGPDEAFTMTTPAAVTTAPLAEDGRAEESPFGPSPWLGALVPTTHRYSNGCTDHREVELLALVGENRSIPIIIGWRRPAQRHRSDPRFLTRLDELPENARGSRCVAVMGSVVVYAHQGYGGYPAYAVEATQIDPAACP